MPPKIEYVVVLWLGLIFPVFVVAKKSNSITTLALQHGGGSHDIVCWIASSRKAAMKTSKHPDVSLKSNQGP